LFPGSKGRASLLRPQSSDIRLLGKRQCVINFDTEITDGTFNLGVSKENLDRTQIARSFVDQRRFGSAQRMCAIEPWFKFHAKQPVVQQSRILPGRQVPIGAFAAWKKKLPRLSPGGFEIPIDGLTSLLRQLEYRAMARS
jgi:hypothetical protein